MSNESYMLGQKSKVKSQNCDLKVKSQDYGSKVKTIRIEKKAYDLRQRAYVYALDVINFLDGLPRGYIVDTIGKQLLRSATSIGANIVEARASSSRRDFINFYSYSLKSANESKFWLGLLKDSKKVPTDRVSPILGETKELSNILASSILTLKGKRNF